MISIDDYDIANKGNYTFLFFYFKNFIECHESTQPMTTIIGIMTYCPAFSEGSSIKA